MVPMFRRALATTAGVIGVAWLVSGCSGATGSSAGGGQSASAAIAIETSQLFVTVRNQANGPLVDLRITVQPVGTSPGYAASINRMEGGEKRDLSLTDFRSNDGTSLNLRFVRPKQVVVTASDLVGKKFEITTPWK